MEAISHQWLSSPTASYSTGIFTQEIGNPQM